MMKCSDAEIAAARAALPNILPTTLKREGHLLAGPCPFHNEATPGAFKVYPPPKFDWHYHCFSCGAHGSAIDYVMLTKRLTFPDAVRELVGAKIPAGLASVTAKKASRATEVPSLVLDLWRTATAPRLAQFYLESRGIAQKALPTALRGHKAVPCKETGTKRPCMLAAITDAAGRITAIQRTWLEDRLVYDGQTNFEKGARAAGLEAPKKTLGPMGNGAVRLSAAGEVIGLCEGVESSLAAAKLFRIGVWATCGAARMGSIELPDVVRHVVIFGDNDEPGRAAAAKAESAYRRRGYSVQVEMPETDWAGMLL
jgi:DNA primase